MSKPWFRFPKGAKSHKGKDTSPLATSTKKNTSQTSSQSSQKLKQPSLSKYFASPSRGEKRPLPDTDEGRPTKRCNTEEQQKNTKDHLQKFEFSDNVDDFLANEPVKPILVEKLCKPPQYDTKTAQKPCKLNNHDAKGPKLQYTPLEQQFVDIKSQYPDALLLIECGYKFRFFGDDADAAAEALNIVSHLDHSFNTASIPTHRLFVHVRRLVAKGYKVGVVKQTETSALKATSESGNSRLFERKLSALYTKSTLVGQDVETLTSNFPVDPEASDDDQTYKLEANINESNSGILMCIKEAPANASPFKAKKPPKESDTVISFVAVNPSTGKFTHESFFDSPSRSALETRLAILQPVELLLPPDLSQVTERVIEKYRRNPNDVRIERMSVMMMDSKKATEQLSMFCKDSSSSSSLLDLDPELQVCVTSLIDYLKDFRLDSVFKGISGAASHSFSDVDGHLRLSAAAVRNLELFQNLVDGKEAGTLTLVLNQTHTKFGDRLLRQWISKPLRDLDAIGRRSDAIQEIIKDPSQFYSHLRFCLKGLMDLERGLTTIYYKKCSILDFINVMSSFAKLQTGLQQGKKVFIDVRSALIRESFLAVETNTQDAKDFLNALDEDAVKQGNKQRTFRSYDNYPKVRQTLSAIAETEAKLRHHLIEIRRILASPSIDYISVSGKDFLIEVKNTKAMEATKRRVPDDWLCVQATKGCDRFHTPFVAEQYKRLCALREQLDIDVDQAWDSFLGEFNQRQFEFQQGVQALAVIDCLLALAQVAKSRNYCRPTFVDSEGTLQIKDGRHPVIEELIGDSSQFVPNDTTLTADCQRCMIITGPNMGGKSSYIRQVALMVVMAQMGSWVPASSVELSIFDGVYVRMGASDQILQGASTFMVELREASEIIHDSTSKSLVILDELGRGTSTHDGTAIATATLEHFVQEKRSFTLFVTHYPLLTKLAEKYSGVVRNYHMSFMLEDRADEEVDVQSVQMLYSLTEGKADRSFGLNVGTMAGIPACIIRRAQQKSLELEEKTIRSKQMKTFLKLINRISGDSN